MTHGHTLANVFKKISGERGRETIEILRENLNACFEKNPRGSSCEEVFLSWSVLNGSRWEDESQPFWP